MRRFEHALRLDETPIGEIKINVKSRDDIPALLLGLQHLYVSCREELEALLGCQQFPLPVKRWNWRGFERLRLVLFRRLWWSGAMVYDSRLRPDHGGKDASTSDGMLRDCWR